MDLRGKQAIIDWDSEKLVDKFIIPGRFFLSSPHPHPPCFPSFSRLVNHLTTQVDYYVIRSHPVGSSGYPIVSVE